MALPRHPANPPEPHLEVSEQQNPATAPLPTVSAEDNSKQVANRNGSSSAMADPQPYVSDSSDGADFDLRPPAPRVRPPSLETTADLLLSPNHLNHILHDQHSIARFTAFLSRYKPDYQPLILRYLETQKAIKAVEMRMQLQKVQH